jgi:PAS domain S-box-containing protein
MVAGLYTKGAEPMNNPVMRRRVGGKLARTPTLGSAPSKPAPVTSYANTQPYNGHGENHNNGVRHKKVLLNSPKHSTGQFEAVLNSTADAIIATDGEGNISLVSQAAETLFQINGQDLMGLPLVTAPFFPPLKEKLALAFADSQVRLGGRHIFDFQMDSDRFLLAFVSAIPENGSWVAVFQDISHLKREERARINFIQAAAHELRNPLGVTLSALTMLQRMTPHADATTKEIFDIGLRGVNRMQDLIDDLLDLERVESRVGLRLQTFDVGQMVERCVLDMRHVVTRKNQILTASIEANLTPFHGDERWLSRALTNLISNAHKYTQEGGAIKVFARTQQTEARSELLLQVEDNGPGIPRDALPHLFEKFYRVPSTSSKEKGTGLGLSIVKSVAEQHAGYVFVRSELEMFTPLWRNRGSIFSIVLPIQG